MLMRHKLILTRVRFLKFLDSRRRWRRVVEQQTGSVHLSPHATRARTDLVGIESLAVVFRIAEFAVCSFAKAATHAHSTDPLKSLSVLEEYRFFVWYSFRVSPLLGV
jgi:hypothetical protein